jgi:hypothetical protein
MRAALDIGGALVLLATLISGCYAHGPWPGPTCGQDPSNPACYPPLTDDKKPDAGR